jgi:hypothetical protein
MPRKQRIAAEELRQTLQEWDATLGDAQLSAQERLDIERTLAVEPPPELPIRIRPWRSPYALATGGGLAVVLVLLVAWGWSAIERPSPGDQVSSGRSATSPVASDSDGTSDQAPEPGRPVQVQLIASGGTRIVWVLNPELPAFSDNMEEKSYAK